MLPDKERADMKHIKHFFNGILILSPFALFLLAMYFFVKYIQITGYVIGIPLVIWIGYKIGKDESE